MSNYILLLTKFHKKVNVLYIKYDKIYYMINYEKVVNEMKTTVHIISHSHWDREWYMAFEKHRMKLVELLDTASDLLEKDENYHSFHMDGHTAAYDDYLEIKPEQKE